MSEHFRLRRVPQRTQRIPIVLLPGLFIGRAMWEGVLAQCALHGRTAIVSETSFLGMNGAPATIAELADLLAYELDIAGVDRAVVVGGSFGGLLALEFAGRHASHVKLLVLSGAPGFGNDFRAGARSRGALTVARAFEIAARVVRDPTLVPPRIIEEARREIVDPARFQRLLRLLRTAQQSRTDELIRRIASPTTLIWGAHDGVTPLARWTDAIDEAWKVRIVPDAGHAPMLEAPIPYAQALFASIDDLSAARLQVFVRSVRTTGLKP